MTDPKDHATTAGEAQIAPRESAKHTKGPWTTHPNFPDMVIPAEHSARSIGASIHDHENRTRYAQVVARVSRDDRHGRGSREANARLIAAAPELAEALDWLLASINATDCDAGERLVLAKAAARVVLAKAIGEPT